VKNTAECQALWAAEVLKKKGKPEIDAIKVMQSG